MERVKKAIAKLLRMLSIRIDGSHLVVIEHTQAHGVTMVGYLSALARKKGFKSWTEYHQTAKAKRAGRHLQAKEFPWNV